MTVSHPEPSDGKRLASRSAVYQKWDIAPQELKRIHMIFTKRFEIAAGGKSGAKGPKQAEIE
jgi:hypothetical protein